MAELGWSSRKRIDFRSMNLNVLNWTAVDRLYNRLLENSTNSSVKEIELRQGLQELGQRFVGLFEQEEIDEEVDLIIHECIHRQRFILELDDDVDYEEYLASRNANMVGADFPLNFGWLDEHRFSSLIADSCVQHYLNYFEHHGDVRRDILRNAAQILSRCNNPGNWEGNKRGLAYGLVQSGKTANMQLLSLLAFASGFDLVVVLTSDNIQLRNQTQQRFDEIFGNRGSIRREANCFDVKSPTSHNDAVDAGQSVDVKLRVVECMADGSRLKQFIVLKKNKSVLSKWVVGLEGITRHNFKALILDDEGDFASMPRTRGTRPIYDLIVRLSKALRQSDFISYTATPYKCIAADVNAPIGYPKDFIWILEPRMIAGNGVPAMTTYTGGMELFHQFPHVVHQMVPQVDWPAHVTTEAGYQGLSLAARDALSRDANLEKEEKEFVLNSLASNTIPSSMVSCFVDFAIAGAYRWMDSIERTDSLSVRVEKSPDHAMMLHLSRLKEVQGDFVKLAELAWLQAKCILRDERAMKARISEFHERAAILGEPLSEGSEFDYALETLIEIVDEEIYEYNNRTGEYLLGHSKFYLLNSDTAHQLNYVEESPLKGRTKKASVFIGGDKLSRGLTIEGLCTAYYVRSQKEPLGDTVSQMARWYGHKAHYMHLLRVYTQRHTLALFKDIAYEDLRLRFNIKSEIWEGNSPEEMLIYLQHTPLFKNTSRDFLENMVSGLLADHRHGAIQFRDFRPEVTAIEQNAELVSEYCASLGPGQTVHDRGVLHSKVDFVSLNEFLKKVLSPIAAHGTPLQMSTFLEHWHQRNRRSFPDLNVVFMNGDRAGGYRERKRAGLTDNVQGTNPPNWEQIQKDNARCQFDTVTGGARGSTFKGDRHMDFSEADHKKYSSDELKKRRKDILLLVYLFDPNYVTKRGPKSVRFERGDDGYIDTDKGILALVMYLPNEGRPRVRSLVNQTIQQAL